MDELNLSRSYEELLLRAAAPRRVRAVLVTGFLGSGKTSLLHHLLSERCGLRLAVLQNEFASADVDSGTLDALSLNAISGLPLLSLPDGCACCKGLQALRDTVRSVLSRDAALDALVVETTGLADPAPVAEVLEECGVWLDCVATVVDAECIAQQLQTSGTAARQIACADVVLINKCDVASLGAVADAEDAVARLAPVARTLRCSHGRVPLAAVLDVQERTRPAGPAVPAGFLSHEPPATARRELQLSAEAPRGRKAQAPAPTGFHALELERLTSVVWRCDAAPLCAARLLAWLTSSALPARGLLRAKGQLWLAQSPMASTSLQLSGARRSVVVEGEPWEGPPSSALVLIGSDRAVLNGLVAGLDALGVQDSGPAGLALAADARFVDVEERGGYAEFSMRGMPSRGLEAAALNGQLMRAVNAAGRLVLWGAGPGRAGDVRRLRCFGGGEEVAEAAGRVLRQALGGASGCDC